MRKDLKPEMSKKYNTIALYTLVVALVIVGIILAVVFHEPIGAVFGNIIHILSPVFYGLVFAYVLCPVCNLFDRLFGKLKGEKKIHKYFLNYLAKGGGIVVTYILFIAFLVGVFNILIPQITDSVNTFYYNYKDYIVKADKFLEDLVGGAKFIPEETAITIEKKLIDIIESFVETIFEFSPVLINKLSGFAIEIWNIVLGIVISIYMLAERKKFTRQSKKLLYGTFSLKAANAIYAAVIKTHEVFGGFMLGKILDSIIIGILCFVGTSVLQIPYAPLVSLVVGITNVIPYFGPFLGAIPSAVIVFLNDPVKCLWFIIFVFLLQQLDGNVIGPKILGETIGVSSFWIIVSILLFGGLYGVVGMLVAVPIFALLNIAVTKLCNESLKKKGIKVSENGSVIVLTPEEDEDEDGNEVSDCDGEYVIQDGHEDGCVQKHE